MAIATGNNGIITGAITTCHNKDDRSQVTELLKDIKTKEILGDPGYDGENIYQAIRTKGMKPTIRPPNNLITKRPKLNVSRVLRINKQKDIMHGGIKTNMDVGSWYKIPSSDLRDLLVVNFYQEKTIT